MKVVFDTNVIVSAAWRDRDPQWVVFKFLAQPGNVWLVTPEILDEYQRVIQRRKFDALGAERQAWLNLFHVSTTLITVSTDIEFPRDPTDAKFIACALAGKADYLITGDRDFVEARAFGSTTILSVQLFKQCLIDSFA